MFEVAGIGVFSVFLAGIVSFLSPCVLPLVPGYVSYVAGRSVDEMRDVRFARARVATLGLSLSFVLGFSAVFIALGASATALGQLFQSYRSEADIVAGTIIVLFGLHMTGVLKLALLNRDIRFMTNSTTGTPLGAFVLGAAFAFGWTPCIGPILGAILTLSAVTTSVSGGIALLSVYSLGLAIPFLLVAAFTGRFLNRIRKLGKIGRSLQITSGALLTVVGLAMMTGYLSSAGTWMLNTFPIFQGVVL